MIVMFATRAGYAQSNSFTPHCDGSNDTTQFSAIIATIGANRGTIRLTADGPRCAIDNLTIPANVTLDNTDGIGIKVNTGQTLTALGPIVDPNGKQIFHNVLSEQGTVSLAGNVTLTKTYAAWFGAVGNGTTDNAAFILAAGNASINAGLPLYLPSGTYKVNSLLTFDGALKLQGDGESTVWDGSSITNVGGGLITIRGSVSATATTLSSNADYAATTLNVGSSKGFSGGDRVTIISSGEPFSQSDTNYKKGEQAIIASVGTGKIRIVEGLKESYLSAGKVTISKINTIVNPSIHGLKILGGGPAKRQHAVDVFYADRAQFSDVFIDHIEDAGISLEYCDNSYIENCHAANMFGTTNGVGYAFSLDLLTQNSAVRGCTTDNVSSGFSTGGYLPTWNCVCENNRFQNGTSLRAMIQTHINGTNIVVSNNVLNIGLIGIASSGRGMTVTGNTVVGMSWAGIYAHEDGGIRLQVLGNKVSSYRGIVIAPTSPLGEKASVVVSNNDLTGRPTVKVADGISCGAENATIASNRIRNHSPGMLINESRNSRITNNEIIDTRSVNQPFGIHLYTATTVSGIVVEGNRIYSDIKSETTYAIFIERGVEGTVITKNILKDVVGEYVHDLGTRTVVLDNTLGVNKQL